MSAPILETPRLILRHWKKEDLPLFSQLNQDPKVMEFFPSALSEKESDQFAQNIEKELTEKDYGFWAVELKKTNQFIGFVGLHYQDFPASFTPCVEIGWRLMYNEWGKGYALEAALKVLHYAFHTLKFEEIVSFTTVKNVRSRRLMERLKMTHDQNDDFEHPKLSKMHPLRLHVLYRKTAN